ncbi:MAG TPA: patatin-like phospholipase family protein [Chthoniobacterales bacterium]|nr:patatin-like phospholipase family protein [Chthoniobacterales bacterium]
MPKRLAITVAGAVSLGSYEAGVLYEIVEALRQHNEDPRTPPNERIEIDVLTGASAGGMTATIAAQKLLFDAPALRDPVKNSFRQPWVEDIDLMEMLKYDKDENEFASFFSSNLIRRIADKHLLARYEGTPPAPKPHPAAAKTIRLGLALSNMNGIDFKRDLDHYGSFTYSRFQDEQTVELSDANDNRTSWEPLRTAALSCGAFPFAFRPVELLRTNAQYSVYRYFVQFPAPGEIKHAFTDGGVFQNEPLGLAKRLVDATDKQKDEPNRFYLFIAPGAKTGTSVPPQPGEKAKKFFNAQANLAQTAMQLISAIFSQARFHDWIMAQDVNERVRLFNSRALQLHRDMMLDPADPSYIDWRSLRPAADALLPVLFGERQQQNAVVPSTRNRPAETREAARTRLREQFSREYAELTASFAEGAVGNEAANTWLDAIMAFEKAAELHGKDEMHIYGITATDDELSGELLSAFGGFFDHRYREHDYLVGRKKAQEFLAKLNGPGALATTDGLGPIRFTPGSIPPISAQPVRMKDLDKERRKQFVERILSRASRGLEEAGLPSVIVAPLRIFFLRPKLNKLLEL